MSKLIKAAALALAALCLTPHAQAQTQTSAYPKPGAPAGSTKAYLFAHMMTGDYGVLYYSVSLDGLHWTFLNKGKPVYPPYHGHASIAKGPDNRYYLVGNKGDDDPLIRFWVSDDLIHWSEYGTYQPDLSKAVDHPLQRIGAPKLFFDKTSGQFMLSWHTPNVPGTPDEPETYWSSQRTLYVLSPDLKTFAAAPKRLFKWEMATIDTVIQPNPEGGYCAVLKDERYPSYNWTTGKTVRITLRPHPDRPLSGARPIAQPQFPRSPDPDPFTQRRRLVPLLRAIRRHQLRPVDGSAA